MKCHIFSTFDGNNQLRDRTPIARPAILVAHQQGPQKKLQLVAKLGRNTFYLPHGIFVTPGAKAVFTTDVGSHQVRIQKKLG